MHKKEKERRADSLIGAPLFLFSSGEGQHPPLCLLPEIGLDLLHAPGLGHVKGAAPVAVSAPDAVPGVPLQVFVVAPGKLIPGPGQVVVLVDQAHVQARRAGLAVVAVDTRPGGLCRGKGAQTE